MRLLLVFAMLAISSSAVVAQVRAPQVTTTSTTTANAKTPSVYEKTGSDPSFSKRVTGTILAVDTTRRLLTIECDDKSQLTLVVDKKARAKADKGTPLEGRKDLSLSDYKPGQIVKVTYEAEDARAIEIRLKRPKTD